MADKPKENLDYNEYPEGHWNTTADNREALEKYLLMYEDVYSGNNLKKMLLEVELLAQEQKLRVLDFGGGIGIVSISLAKLGHEVTLVEGSSASLETAKYYADRENLSIELVHLKDFKNLDKESFDCIVLKDVIEHVNDDTALMLKLYSLLKTEGGLLMSTQNNYSANFIIEGIFMKLRNPFKKWLGWDPTHVRWYNCNSLNKLIDTAEFVDVRYSSTYIVPYKILLRLMPWVDSKKDNFLFRIDKTLQGFKMFNKIGWNILVVCRKKTK